MSGATTNDGAKETAKNVEYNGCSDGGERYEPESGQHDGSDAFDLLDHRWVFFAAVDLLPPPVALALIFVVSRAFPLPIDKIPTSLGRHRSEQGG